MRLLQELKKLCGALWALSACGRFRTCLVDSRRYSAVRLLQVLLLLSATAASTSVQAAKVCAVDVGGVDDATAQSDITQLCLDDSNLPVSFDVYMSWDATAYTMPSV
jgi:hypothetical protein